MKKFNLFGKCKDIYGTEAQKLYDSICWFESPRERKEGLGEDIVVVEELYEDFWKPRYLLDNKNKTAVEFMNGETILQTISEDDIDWKSLEGLPQKAIDKAKKLDAVFPTFVRNYKNGVALVEWQLNPDGRYYMDDDGFGITNDEEITIYGFIDRAGKPLVKFKYIKDFGELDEMEEEAKKNLRKTSTNMKRKLKIAVWSIVATVLLLVCVLGGKLLKDYLYFKLNPPFEETTIFPDDTKANPSDTTLTINGINIKMIGVRGGKINCKGLTKAIELDDFYIGETEVSQELWMSIMGSNPSFNKDSVMCPVEGVDLVECLDFVHKLDSVSGIGFYIQSHPQWLYAAILGKTGWASMDSVAWYKNNSDNTTHPVKQKKPNALGVYDMIGNVAEWTMSGSDPFFFASGGSFETEKEDYDIDKYEIDHANIKTGTIGLRLVCYPNTSKK